MADFAAILKKTLDKMGETTPDVRAKVYDRARQTVRRQIDAMATPPSQAAIDRQFEKLEAAINEIETGYGAVAMEPVVEPEPEPAPTPAEEALEPAEEVAEAEPAPTADEEAAEPVEQVAEAEPVASADEEVAESAEEAVEDAPVPSSDDEAMEPVEEAVDDTVGEPEAEPVDEMPPTAAMATEDDDVSIADETAIDDVDDHSAEIDDAPIDEAPIEDAPTEDVPIEDTSTADVLAEHITAQDEPADDTPIEDGPLVAAVPDDASEPAHDSTEPERAPPIGDQDISDWIDEVVDADAGLPPADALVEFLNEQKEQLTPSVPDDAERAADALFDEMGDVDNDSAPVPPEIGDAPPSDLSASDPVVFEDPPRRRTGLAVVLLLLVGVVVGGGFAAYAYQAPLRTFLADYGIDLPEFGSAGEGVVSTEDGIPVRTVETQPAPETETADGSNGEATDTQPETAEAGTNDTVDAGSNEEAAPKFTQRLTPDGREVDEGPTTEPSGPGEGSSVAGQTASGSGTETPAPDAEASTDDASESVAPVAVGQRTIFYEERTGSQAGTALQGATVWSVVQEAPGGDLPLEPAIRAQSSVPDLGMTLEMTIRRNGDATFPASHIVELFFNVPGTFEGRGIADVQRITFKDTEQDPGSALIAVPAPLDTNIFLVALTDAQTAIDTNIALMRSQGWLDIPMQYVSGRRALITMEKGVAGDRVFNEVFEAWQAAPLGAFSDAEPSEAEPVAQ